MKMQSIVLFSLKPNCDSGKSDLSSAHSINLTFIIDVNIFPMLFRSVIPR